MYSSATDESHIVIFFIIRVNHFSNYKYLRVSCQPVFSFQLTNLFVPSWFPYVFLLVLAFWFCPFCFVYLPEFFTFVTLLLYSVTSLTYNLLAFSDNSCYYISEQRKYRKSPHKGNLGKGNEDTSRVKLRKEWFPRNS